jgi:hypothetical protein
MWTPQMNSCVCVNLIFVRVECFVEREFGAVLRCAGEEGTVFSCLREGCVCVCVFGAVGVCVSFEVGVSVGYGIP